MVIDIQIEDAQKRLKELVAGLGPEDEVRLLNEQQIIARIKPEARRAKPPVQNSPEEFRAWLDAFVARHRPVTEPVDDSRESIY